MSGTGSGPSSDLVADYDRSFRLRRQPGVEPRGKPAGHVVGVVPGPSKPGGGHRRPNPRQADERDLLVAGNLLCPRSYLRELDVARARDVAGLPLVVLAHVDEHHVTFDHAPVHLGRE
jgi:hypothetical protein